MNQTEWSVPKRLSLGVFPLDNRSVTFRRWVQHSIESAHQLSFRPDCNNTAEVPSFTLRTAPSAIPLVSDRCGVDVQWYQERSSQALPNSKELSVKMTLGFLSGSRKFCKLLWVSCEVLFCTDMLGSIEWLSPAPPLQIGDFFEIHNCHWEPCDLLLSISKISARGTSPPLQLLHGALVILSSDRSRNFGPLGNEYNDCAHTKSSRLLNMGSKNTLWEELAWESPCRGISSSTKVSLNSCSHSGISEHNGLSRSIVVSFLIGFCFFLAWVSSSCPDLSSFVVDTITEEMSLSIRSSRSRVLVSLFVSDENKLEENEEEWLQSWKCLWSWKIQRTSLTNLEQK